MSSSEEEASLEEERWDDMAIVRAFDEALTGKRREHKAAKAKSTKGNTKTRSGKPRKQSDASATTGSGRAAFTNSYEPRGPHAQHANTAEHQPPLAPHDVSQAAYTQAYAHLQAQWQASQASYGYPQYPQPPASAAPPSSYPAGPQPGYPWPQHPPFASPSPSPFPGMPGQFPPSFNAPPSTQDDLANLLLAWYQSGYYTGRYQAMQEMRGRHNI